MAITYSEFLDTIENYYYKNGLDTIEGNINEIREALNLNNEPIEIIEKFISFIILNKEVKLDNNILKIYTEIKNYETYYKIKLTLIKNNAYKKIILKYGLIAFIISIIYLIIKFYNYKIF